jgi:hypothetical protein
MAMGVYVGTLGIDSLIERPPILVAAGADNEAAAVTPAPRKRSRAKRRQPEASDGQG